ncbi:two-component system, sensor histidine kinase and response regulator [Fistulifera solaris]|uniref:histidine kinase n=1 Tax=Fistulifera solaris TaxID=1519565 RepID=A0A1Z5K6Z3_FISSO|nr:two-component system, sensor histidine kinase and response regulator [Fistulifera solaris]|eukprot:GAX21932.1 two-component system, sensor histidine kinase and response regulator [Fistulifera solaris]
MNETNNMNNPEDDDSKMTSTPKNDEFRQRNYTRQDLYPFNLLQQAIWVFDVERKSMWWANAASIRMWNATSLESLLERDCATDMSEATERQINSYLEGFRRGESFTELYTFYPLGKSVTGIVRVSGILADGRLMMMNEFEPIEKIEKEQKNARRTEILKHIPIAIWQFESNGNMMEQNPESLKAFGGSTIVGPSFLDRFIDREVGQHTLTQILNQQSYCVEACLQTLKGPRWFSIEGRIHRDPITSSNVILCSARDTTEVRQARIEAEQADLEKSEFLAVMAHELRTPLHQVIGYTELLQDTQLSPRQDEYVRTLDASAKSLMTIINDLLDYSKLEAGKMKFETIPFDPRHVVGGTLAAIADSAERKGLKLESSFCDDLPVSVAGDPTRVRQILLNLAHNAVKFTARGSIQIAVRKSATSEIRQDGKTCLRFEVIDTGIGLSDDSMRKLFTKYQQANPAIARNFGGTGLGLSICKLLVNAIGGHIGVESKTGQGSTFWFELPFAINDASGNIKPPVAKQSKPVDKQPAKLKTHTGPSLKVLVAEDNLVNQKLAKSLLLRLGHEVFLVENGYDATLEVDRRKYDLVLMDVQMPVMGGMEATALIRQKYPRSELPIVGLTADFRKAELQKYIDAGMNYCVGKPIRLNELMSTIYKTVHANSGKVTDEGLRSFTRPCA